MAEHREQITELAELMQEYKLSEARLTLDGLTIGFRKRRAAPPPMPTEAMPSAEHTMLEVADFEPEPLPEPPRGTPITSPMTGIYYSSPSPSAPPFVREGDTVSAGQVIALIEAMKVFNEIPAPVSGTVLKVVAQSGQLVQPGETLLIVG